MPRYTSDWTKHDAGVLSACPVPALAEGAIRCRMVIQTFAGARSDSGAVQSGVLGGHTGRWYGKEARSGHKNDAEIIALDKLWTRKQIPSGTPGTCYVLGTDGPCDSCKEVLRLLRRKFTQLEFKFLYRRRDLKNVTQGDVTAYGWKDDKVIEIDGTGFYYHYMDAIDAPNPVTEEDMHKVLVALNRTLSLVKYQDVALKDWRAHLENETKKRLLPILERIINEARARVSMAVNAWGERRRFGKESNLVAAERTVENFHPIIDWSTDTTQPLTPLEIAEFYRRVTNNAQPGDFGNWYAPE